VIPFQSAPRRTLAALCGALAIVAGSGARSETQPPDFDRQIRQQAQTDRAWRLASRGRMSMEKITYASHAGGLAIPAFVFSPLGPAATASRPALVWVHEDVRGHLYEHYIPYVLDAIEKGYVVIAPEYRGSIGYGRAFFDAIDYGGAEVDDVVTAVDVLKSEYLVVNASRIAVVGWSHGGLIAMLAVLRHPGAFRAAVAMVPVTNLLQRLELKGAARQHQLIDPQNRFGGLPSDRPDVYRDRSPLFSIDKLSVPLYVAVATNDEDVSIAESMPLIEALRARKPRLAETTVYTDPPGGHLFDRRVAPLTWRPENTPEQIDSWKRVWRFLGRALTVGEARR
jgi:dipeptidyl aminopeptidase/acylaminoacyl peptidase